MGVYGEWLMALEPQLLKWLAYGVIVGVLFRLYLPVFTSRRRRREFSQLRHFHGPMKGRVPHFTVTRQLRLYDPLENEGENEAI